MLGEKQQMWLKELEIAVIEKNIDKIDELLKSQIEFSNINDAKRAQYLLAEASELLHKMKNETSAIMKQLKRNIDFLKVSERKNPSRLDIRS